MAAYELKFNPSKIDLPFIPAVSQLPTSGFCDVPDSSQFSDISDVHLLILLIKYTYFHFSSTTSKELVRSLVISKWDFWENCLWPSSDLCNWSKMQLHNLTLPSSPTPPHCSAPPLASPPALLNWSNHLSGYKEDILLDSVLALRWWNKQLTYWVSLKGWQKTHLFQKYWSVICVYYYCITFPAEFFRLMLFFLCDWWSSIRTYFLIVARDNYFAKCHKCKFYSTII